MNKLLTILLILLANCAIGQNTLILEKRNNSKKEIILNSTSQYVIKTINETYKSNIIEFTNSTLTVETWKKLGTETIYKYNQNGKEIKKARPDYIKIKTIIAFKDIP